jgi:hypothetical protein
MFRAAQRPPGFEMNLPFLRPVEPSILDPEVSEIMVNGPERVFVERRGFLEPVPVTLNPKSLLVAVKNVARRLGSDISDEKRILDSRLADGSRVAAVIPPCSLTGVTLTIRKFNASESADRGRGAPSLRARSNGPQLHPDYCRQIRPFGLTQKCSLHRPTGRANKSATTRNPRATST